MRHVNVLLAGGASRRFGEPKAFVNWRNKMFYEWGKTALGDKKPVIISHPELIKRFQKYGEKNVFQDVDPFQGLGPLAGIYTAFEKTDGDVYTVLSCDTPLIKRSTLLALRNGLNERTDAVVPVSEGREQPLMAVYHKRISSFLYEQLSQKRLKISDFLHQLSVCYVDAEEIGAKPEEFMNINTRCDYHKMDEQY
ncbi:molybdenum cofactor guanylyltransferase [Bacillus atrophaeus]|uniref:molybdenum cofactor guanylyltransferase n=1 Tax=Bacillus atrophaeus TaxID=1452 RepID=UPI002281E14A|nr:molybdenum cofactor guanylyltransferase [Bacillus atrophaeus]MCY8464694.1 molybdenum cofactor guanylyltransferase [Bacillus atrophaeus]MCY8476147.1 molybdenum cofactor guanylyltransferase [Bacillus atrophaeus]MCY8958829.1 molybdenum cofactor guanylyltransferase [Bacillus atrophaeus]MCY8964404.1 molybdenum cofactor guanylyltransferase [Bacillus atrophaeus]MCY9134108.1 molybdenum cofactor guanylyltransferase [Bacillus atrophaeus]